MATNFWAGVTPAAKHRAAASQSSQADKTQNQVNVDSVQSHVINPLEKLIATVNTLKSAKPELFKASEILVECKREVNKAAGLLEEERQAHSLKM